MELRTYWKILRRRWWLVVVPVLVVALYAAGTYAPPGPAYQVVMRFSATGMTQLRSHWRVFAGMALFNNVVPYVLLIWAQHSVASGLASILIATTPVFTVLVAQLAIQVPALMRLGLLPRPRLGWRHK